MTAAAWIAGVLVVVVVWLTVGVPIALVVGRVIRNRDRQTPRDE